MLGEGIKIEAVNLMLPNGTVHVDDSLAVTPSQLGVLLHKNVILTGLQF